MPDKDDLDLLLDSALRTYADPGRGDGLEQRVLARIGEARNGARAVNAVATPRRRWLPWAIALPVAAGVMLLLLLTLKIQHSPPDRAQLTHESAQSPALPRAVAPAEAQPEAAHLTRKAGAIARSPSPARVAKVAPLPKLDVFPTPQPLTPQEQAFAVFAVHGPERERKAFAEAQQQIDAPLSIAAINIPPIKSPYEGTN